MDNVINLKGQKMTPENESISGITLEKPVIFQKEKKPNIFKRLNWFKYRFMRYTTKLLDVTYYPVRNYFFRIYGDRYFTELVRLVTKLNRENFQVFIHTSPHTHSVQIYIHMGGWVNENRHNYHLPPLYMPGHTPRKKSKPSDIKAISALILALSKANHLYPDNSRD